MDNCKCTGTCYYNCYVLYLLLVPSIPVHSDIILPLIVYNNDPEVYVEACSVIYHIMSSANCIGGCILWVCANMYTHDSWITGAVLEELAERAVGSTLEGLRKHHDNHTCLEWGCRVLRTLIMDRYALYTILCHIMQCCVSYFVSRCGCHILYYNHYMTVLIKRNTWRCVQHCLIWYPSLSNKNLILYCWEKLLLLSPALQISVCHCHPIPLGCYWLTYVPYRTNTKGGLSSAHLC